MRLSPATVVPPRGRASARRVPAWTAALLALACCSAAGAPAESAPPATAEATAFPKPNRRVARIVSDRWLEEEARDRFGEAERVLDLLHVKPGMAVADIGAGEGYFAVRAAARVGAAGKVVAEDIVPETVAKLRARAADLGLAQLEPLLGRAHDPMLPPGRFDRVLLIHMYHEIDQPFGLLWNLAPSLKTGGLVGIVDVDRRTGEHGTPKALLRCELAAVGYRLEAMHELQPRGSYLAVFHPPEVRPAPGDVRPCADARN